MIRLGSPGGGVGDVAGMCAVVTGSISGYENQGFSCSGCSRLRDAEEDDWLNRDVGGYGWDSTYIWCIFELVHLCLRLQNFRCLGLLSLPKPISNAIGSAYRNRCVITTETSSLSTLEIVCRGNCFFAARSGVVAPNHSCVTDEHMNLDSAILDFFSDHSTKPSLQWIQDTI